VSWYVHFLTMDDETITLAASKLFDSLDDARDHATLFHIRPGWAIPGLRAPWCHDPVSVQIAIQLVPERRVQHRSAGELDDLVAEVAVTRP